MTPLSNINQHVVKSLLEDGRASIDIGSNNKTLSPSTVNRSKALSEQVLRIIQADKPVRKELSEKILRIIQEEGKDLKAMQLPASPLKKHVSFDDLLDAHLGTGWRAPTGPLTAIALILKKRELVGKGGFMYPAEPQILDFIADNAKGKMVLDIGGAYGAHAVFSVYAGAKRSYMNEIDAESMKNFTFLKSHLPSEIGEKLVPLPGNCLKILEKNASLAGKVDLIICRNVIHFFTDEETTAFFQLLKNLLAPGGQAIISVNSVYLGGEDIEKLVKQNPQMTCVTRTHCRPGGGGEYSPIIIYDNYTPLPAPPSVEEMRPDKALELVLYQRSAQTGKFERNKQVFSQIDPKQKNKIQKAINKFLPSLEISPFQSIIWSKTIQRVHSKKTLEELITRHGFTSRATFVVDPKSGHLTSGDDHALFEKGAGQVGVIITSRTLGRTLGR